MGHQREVEIWVELAFTTAQSAGRSGAPTPDDAIGSPGDWKEGEMEVEEQFGSASEEVGGMARAEQNGSFPLSFPFVIFFLARKARRGRGCPRLTLA